MQFLDDSLLPENQQPLVIQAAEVDQIVDTLATLIAAQADGAQSAA